MNERKLIQKFLANKCTSQEAELVDRLLEERPDLLDTILSEDDWQHHLKNYPKNSESTISWSKAFLPCILILSFLLLWSIKKTNEIDLMFSHNNKYYNNTSDSIQEILLEDGSAIQLYPNSLFKTNFAYNRIPIRHTELIQGKATISVYKDRSKPFVVDNGSLYVTALGTQFTIQNNPDTHNSFVVLHEGKIKVDVIQKNNQYILKPGEEISYENHSVTRKINTPIEAPLIVRENKKSVKYSRPSSIFVTENSIIMNGTSLKEALTFISEELDVPIAYHDNEIRNYEITGTFMKPNKMLLDIDNKEIIANEILEIITSVNPLEIVQKHKTKILLIKTK